MSAQTIIYKNLHSLYEKAIGSTIENSKKYNLFKKFKLGNNYCQEEQFHNSMIIEIYNLNNCSLNQYVKERIESGEDKCFKIDL